MHLLDVRSGNSKLQRQAVNHLQTCVEALQEMSVAWCAWGTKALRALQLLAKEWSAVDVLYSTFPTDPSGQLCSVRTDQDARESFQQAQSLYGDLQSNPAFPNSVTRPAPDSFDLDLGFLFESVPPSDELDALVKSWLTDSGYAGFS